MKKNMKNKTNYKKEELKMPQLTAQQLIVLELNVLEGKNVECQEGETLYEFSLDSDGAVIYRHCGTGKGCFWTGWEPNGQFIK